MTQGSPTSTASNGQQPSPVRSIRLQLWLPLTLALVGLLTILTLSYLEHQHYQQELRRFTEHTAHRQLLETRRAVETALRRSDGSGLDAVLSELGLHPTVHFAALVDDAGEVLAATRFAWKHQHASDVIPDYPRALPTEHVTLDLQLDTLHLRTLSPIAIPLQTGQIRSHRQGTLLIDYDLTSLAASAAQHTYKQILLFGSLSILAVLVLLLLGWRFMLRPIRALQATIATIGQGQLDITAPLKGEGELMELSDALVQTAGALRSSQAALARSEAQLRQLSDASQEAIFFHHAGTILQVNRTAQELLGYSASELVGRNIFDLVTPDYRPAIERRAASGVQGIWEVAFYHRDGSQIIAEVNARQHLVDGQPVRVIAARDIRPRLAAEAKIRQLAHFDALTGLPNRRQLLDYVTAELQQVQEQPGRRAALAALNLDNFKAINDSLGMAVGDAALQSLAKRLSSTLPQHQTLARIHGDTFALFITQLSGSLEAASAQAGRSIEAVLGTIAQPLQVRGHTLHLSAGAGVVMIPNDSKDPPELLREAETAMHQSKAAGDNRVRFFAHALQEAASARLQLRNDLKTALHIAPPAPQELLLHYQPQMNAQGQLHGVEALVRWQHPSRGLIPPGAFIAEAESSGLIVPLGNWVLQEAAQALRRWQDAHAWAQPLSMAINVSPRQFREPDFVDRVRTTLEQLGLNALSLELELTESVVADDLAATLEKMQQLRQYGVRFALDDFGTGYSSLSYLKRLPIDTLKIDRSFVIDIDAPANEEGKRPAVLIEAIITMAHQLNMQVLAEGVETPAQRDYLRRAHCDIFQGYFFSKPLPEGALCAWADSIPASVTQ